MKKELKAIVARRKDDNLKILEHLKDIIEEYPDLRFGQILFNYVIPDDFITMGDLFNPESSVYLKYLEKNKPKIKTKQ